MIEVAVLFIALNQGRDNEGLESGVRHCVGNWRDPRPVCVSYSNIRSR